MKTLSVIGLIACLGTAAFADPVLHSCRITKTGQFFADELLFSLDDATGQVMVVDPIIMYYNGERAIEAELAENEAQKTVFTWTMAMTNSSGQTTKMRFRAALQRPSMRLLLKARPAGYNNNFTARGACAVITGPMPGT